MAILARLLTQINTLYLMAFLEESYSSEQLSGREAPNEVVNRTRAENYTVY